MADLPAPPPRAGFAAALIGAFVLVLAVAIAVPVWVTRADTDNGTRVVAGPR